MSKNIYATTLRLNLDSEAVISQREIRRHGSICSGWTGCNTAL